MTRAAHSRSQLVDALSEVFRRRGFAGATLAALAHATGLKRATLYHHFPDGKPAMAAAVLDQALDELNAVAVRHLAGPEPAAARLTQFIAGFGRYTGGGTRPCALTALANAEEPILEARVRSEFARIIDLAAALFGGARPASEAKQLGTGLMGDLYGALTIATITNDSHAFGAALAVIERRYAEELGVRHNAW